MTVPDALPARPPTGIIGLGAMGGPVAGTLVGAGYPVFGYDPDPERRRLFGAAGGAPVASVGDVVANASLIISLLPSADALGLVCDEIARALGERDRPALTLAEMSTFGLSTKVRASDRLEAHGVTVLDCALSGTASQAEVGDLVVYASGDRAVYDRAASTLGTIGRSVYYLGAFGAATRTKLVANHLVAVHIAAAAEALLLARRSGLDLATTLAALTDGAGTSRMLEIRGPRMASGTYDNPSMRLELFLKDVGLIEGFAAEVGSPAPIFDVVARLFRAAVADGRGAQDTAAVFAWLSDQVEGSSRRDTQT